MTTETHERDDQAQPRKSAWSALAAAVTGSVAGVLLAQAIRLEYAPRPVGWVLAGVAGLWLAAIAANRLFRRAR